jgi:hypothetical protein
MQKCDTETKPQHPFKCVETWLGLSIVAAILFCGIILINTFHGDATIYLVYAKNIAAGDFFSFNPGEFSSGSTSPLWAALLSIGYLSGHGVIAAKIVSLVVTLIGIGVGYQTLLTISGSRLGSLAGIAIAAKLLASYGLLMYESSLIVVLAFLLMLEVYQLLANRISTKRWGAISLIWTLIPLTRPDGIVLVGISLLFLTLHFLQSHQQNSLRTIIIIFLISLIPSLVYYGYSFATLGAFSVSSTCRAFALQESAASLGGISYSTELLSFFVSSWIMLVFTILSLLGFTKMAHQKETKVMFWLSVACIVTYLVLLSLVSPVTHYVERYFLPVVPFFVLSVCIAVRQICGVLSGHVGNLAGGVFVVVLVFWPLWSVLLQMELENSLL